MKNFVQQGAVISATAPANLLSGDGVQIGSMFGVASTDAASGKKVELAVVGVFKLPVKAADTVNPGTELFWDAGNGEATVDDDSGARLRIGYAVSAKFSDNSANIRLCP